MKARRGGAYLGNDVDERVGDTGQELDSTDAGARRNQRDVRDTMGRRSRLARNLLDDTKPDVPSGGTDLTELDSLLRWQVDHDETVSSGILGVLYGLFLAV